MNKDESLYWLKNLNFRLALINVCPALVPSYASVLIYQPQDGQLS